VVSHAARYDGCESSRASLRVHDRAGPLGWMPDSFAALVLPALAIEYVDDRMRWPGRFPRAVTGVTHRGCVVPAHGTGPGHASLYLRLVREPRAGQSLPTHDVMPVFLLCGHTARRKSRMAACEPLWDWSRRRCDRSTALLD
jgi:hypothetical protein